MQLSGRRSGVGHWAGRRSRSRTRALRGRTRTNRRCGWSRCFFTVGAGGKVIARKATGIGVGNTQAGRLVADVGPAKSDINSIGHGIALLGSTVGGSGPAGFEQSKLHLQLPELGDIIGGQVGVSRAAVAIISTTRVGPAFGGRGGAKANADAWPGAGSAPAGGGRGGRGGKFGGGAVGGCAQTRVRRGARQAVGGAKRRTDGRGAGRWG